MWGNRYWGARYWGSRYWGLVSGGGIPPAPTLKKGISLLQHLSMNRLAWKR